MKNEEIVPNIEEAMAGNPGIPQEELMKIFEKIQKSFQKAKSRKGEFGVRTGITKPTLLQRKKKANKQKSIIKASKKLNRKKKK